MDFLPGKCLLPQLLLERRITPSELARALGITAQEVSNHSNKRSVMSLATAKRYAHFFKIPIDDLYEWTPVPNKE